mgnify:CR=1 FL=1
MVLIKRVNTGVSMGKLGGFLKRQPAPFKTPYDICDYLLCRICALPEKTTTYHPPPGPPYPPKVPGFCSVEIFSRLTRKAERAPQAGSGRRGVFFPRLKPGDGDRVASILGTAVALIKMK